jgi:UDP-N-acetyl-D-glucosamine dehydrogenase
MTAAIPLEDLQGSFVDLLETNLKNQKATIGVMGLGYVGLPLVRALRHRNYNVIGFDTDIRKIKLLKENRSYIKSISKEEVKQFKKDDKFIPTNDVNSIKNMDAILICVPTPLTKYREPDMNFVVSTAEMIQQNLRRGQLVVLESTTYPGTTAEVLKPILEKSGLKANHDFFLAYSPEREDPGNLFFETAQIPRVVGADHEDARRLAVALYEQVVPKVVEVSSAATAEAVKLTENIFRFINIGLVNELKTIFDKMNIDIWDVIEAAKTKPFGFMPFYPGPGLGGHCIPIDPFYLTWKAREYGIATQYIELSGQINGHMPHYVIERLREELDIRFSKGLNGSKILILGMAYKKNIEDVRESPALVVYELLKSKHALVDFYDAYVSEIPEIPEHLELSGLKSIRLTEGSLKEYDAVVICTDHDDINYEFVLKNSKLVLDTRNATKNFNKEYDNVVKA